MLLVLDRAGWHTGKQVRVPEGIELEFLPAKSPELQPAERLWPLINERVANRHFEEIEELEEALVERCLALLGEEELIRSTANCHWRPDAPRRHDVSTRIWYQRSAGVPDAQDARFRQEHLDVGGAAVRTGALRAQLATATPGA